MNLAVIGTGYVGLVSAVGWAGHKCAVICIDTDEEKVAKVNSCVPPIYEEGMKQRLSEAVREGRLRASTSYSDTKDSSIYFISVGTPSASDGSVDTKYIKAVAESLGRVIADSDEFKIVVVRSTVMPGTTEEIVGTIIEDISGKKAGEGFGLAMIPEFLKEGTALADFDSPDRIVIGTRDEKTRKSLENMHSGFGCPKLFVDIKTAEMTKYASNSFLATKISFVNEVAQICEKLSVDVDEVIMGASLDKRIGGQFMVPGAGFGGSCFPKDVRAMASSSKKLGVEPKLLESVLLVNEKQPRHFFDMMKTKLGDLEGKTIAILGLAFKTQTDDVRESPAIPIVRDILDAGGRVQAYDPKAMENFKKVYAEVNYCSSLEQCLKDVDAAMIITSWGEFVKTAEYYKSRLGKSPLFDARRVLSQQSAKKAGLDYFCIGRGDS